MEQMNQGMEYLERKIKQLVEELKEKNCLSQEFKFLTKAEREQEAESVVDEIIRQTLRQ